jgi:type I site-specific restriction endonuclease
VIEDREYNDRDYDRDLILEKRTTVVASKVTEFLRATNRFAKTIIFCENIDHAEWMRQALVNANPDLAAANAKYVMRIAEQRRIVANVEQLMAWVDALETQLAASRATAANLLSALVAELTGTANTGKVSVPSATGRRGRPPKA